MGNISRILGGGAMDRLGSDSTGHLIVTTIGTFFAFKPLKVSPYKTSLINVPCLYNAFSGISR